jgi:hypothetical protein
MRTRQTMVKDGLCLTLIGYTAAKRTGQRSATWGRWQVAGAGEAVVLS